MISVGVFILPRRGGSYHRYMADVQTTNNSGYIVICIARDDNGSAVRTGSGRMGEFPGCTVLILGVGRIDVRDAVRP